MDRHLAASGRTDEYGTLHVNFEDAMTVRGYQRVVESLAVANPSYLAGRIIEVRHALDAPGDINGNVHDISRAAAAVLNSERPDLDEALSLLESARNILDAIVEVLG